MIITLDTIVLEPYSLDAFVAPKITIIRQSSAVYETNMLHVDLEIKNTDETTMRSASITLPIDMLKSAVQDQKINAIDLVSNLYIYLETLLMLYLQSINPQVQFEQVA